MSAAAASSRKKNVSRVPSAAYLKFVQTVSKEITKPGTAIQVVKKKNFTSQAP